MRILTLRFFANPTHLHALKHSKRFLQTQSEPIIKGQLEKGGCVDYLLLFHLEEKITAQ